MAYVMALDAGTGSVRAVIFDRDGNQVVSSQQEWTHMPDPRYPGSMDFDTKHNWELAKMCMGDAIRRAGIHPVDIRAVSATSFREGFVLYDSAGRELWACANVDARASAEVLQLKQSDPDLERNIYKSSGQTFALGALPRLLWLKNNQPELYERATSLTMINDWLLYKLCGDLAVDPSNGCTTGIFNLADRSWEPSIARSCGLRDDLFPTVREAGTQIGTVLRQVAQETGLAEGTPVVSAGGDAQLASVGVGAVRVGQTFVCGGSFWQQEVNVATPFHDESCRARVNCHAVSDLWQMEAIAFFPGLIMRWFRDTFCEMEKYMAERTGLDAYYLLEQQAKSVPVGSHGIVPVFSDVMNYISWRHASPSLINLNLDPTRCGKKEIFRALEENAAFVTRGNLKMIESVTGFYPTEVIFAGGASKGELWSQILADVLGVPVKVPVVKEAAALGTAIVAGAGVGLYDSIPEAAEQLVRWERVHVPNPAHHKEYDQWFGKWRDIYHEQLQLADKGLTTHMWKAPGL
jgi:autoinducer 2 (AI-2) kinase